MDTLHIAADKLREFALSPSGQVSPAAGLSKGMLVAAIAACAALLGSATAANADYCYGIPEGECGTICTFTDCNEPGECTVPPSSYCYWENTYCHTAEYGCQLQGAKCGAC